MAENGFCVPLRPNSDPIGRGAAMGRIRSPSAAAASDSASSSRQTPLRSPCRWLLVKTHERPERWTMRLVFAVAAGAGVLLFHAYDALEGWSAAWWERLPWQLLYAGFVAVQMARSWRAEALPVRYLW